MHALLYGALKTVCKKMRKKKLTTVGAQLRICQQPVSNPASPAASTRLLMGNPNILLYTNCELLVATSCQPLLWGGLDGVVVRYAHQTSPRLSKNSLWIRASVQRVVEVCRVANITHHTLLHNLVSQLVLQILAAKPILAAIFQKYLQNRQLLWHSCDCHCPLVTLSARYCGQICVSSIVILVKLSSSRGGCTQAS